MQQFVKLDLIKFKIGVSEYLQDAKGVATGKDGIETESAVSVGGGVAAQPAGASQLDGDPGGAVQRHGVNATTDYGAHLFTPDENNQPNNSKVKTGTSAGPWFWYICLISSLLS